MDIIVSSAVPLSSPRSMMLEPVPNSDAEYTTEESGRNDSPSMRSGSLRRCLHSPKARTPTMSLRNSQEAFQSELSSTVTRCLHKCGEDANYLPLFKVVFPLLSDVEDNEYTSRVDSRTGDMIISNLILRMVQHAADHQNLVLFCDDTQCKSGTVFPRVFFWLTVFIRGRFGIHRMYKADTSFLFKSFVNYSDTTASRLPHVSY